MKKHLLPALVALALLLSACGGAAQTSSTAPSVAEPVAVAPAAPPSGGAGLSAEQDRVANEPSSPEEQPASAQGGGERLVIKTATLTLEVENVSAAEAAVRARATALGGYIVTAQTSGTEPDLYSTITIRVPSERFDEALTGVQGLAKRVLSRSVGGEDVTEEFVDLESRMRNLEATRDRLLGLLEKANRVEDALQVNQALNDIQGQIEQARGRMQYLSKSAAMATITVGLQPVPKTPIIENDGWQPREAFNRAARDLVEFGQGLVELAIVIAVWSPVWAPLLLLGRWGLRRIRRAFSKPISAPAAAPAAPSEPSDKA